MITQEYKQGKHTIKIESAESIEDAKKHSFREGEYTRCYVNDKLTDNYMAMIRFIVEEAKTNQETLIPSGPDLMKLREQMFENQNKEITNQLNKLKEQYKGLNLPPDVFGKVDDFINKIDPSGVRIKK